MSKKENVSKSSNEFFIKVRLYVLIICVVKNEMIKQNSFFTSENSYPYIFSGYE